MPISTVGHLYMLEDWTQQVAKIGHGADPIGRCRQCQTGNPNDLVLVAAIPATYGAERAMHKAFRRYQFRREWYVNITLLRNVFCDLEQEVADRCFENRDCVLDEDYIEREVPPLMARLLEAWAITPPMESDPPLHLFITSGQLYPTDPPPWAYND